MLIAVRNNTYSET